MTTSNLWRLKADEITSLARYLQTIAIELLSPNWHGHLVSEPATSYLALIFLYEDACYPQYPMSSPPYHPLPFPRTTRQSPGAPP